MTNFKFDKNSKKLSKWVENSVGKGEIARYEQFLLFLQCFQKACFPGASKGVIVWELVKQLFQAHEKLKIFHILCSVVQEFHVVCKTKQVWIFLFCLLKIQTKILHKTFEALSPTRWHGKHTYLSSLGILGKKQNYFPE